MQHEEASSGTPSTHFVTRLCAAGTFAIGAVAFAGWVLGISTLKSIVPGWVEMKANAALGLMLAGAALACLGSTARTKRRAVGRACASLCVLLGAITLAEYAFKIEPGIDLLLFDEPAGAVGTSHPGRMAGTTAVNLVLNGAALLLIDWETRRRRRPAQILSFLIAISPLQAILGYSYGVRTLLGLGPFAYVTQMAINTAIAWLLVSVGTVFARPNVGILRVVGGSSLAGRTARRLIVPCAFVPPAIGATVAFGFRSGLYDGGFALSVLVLATMIVLGVVVWWNAHHMFDLESKEAAAHEELGRVQKEQQVVLDAAPARIALLAPGNTIVRVNTRFADHAKASTASMEGAPVSKFLPPDRVADHDEILAAGTARTGILEREKNRWVRTDKVPVSTDKGPRLVTFSLDVTDLKEAQDELRKKTAALELLQAVGHAVNDAPSWDDALRGALEQVCNHAGWPLGHAWLVDENGGTLPTRIWHGDAGKYAAFQQATEQLVHGKGEGMAGAAVTTGRPVWVWDLWNEVGYTRVAAAREAGLRSALAVPVLVGPRAGAVLEFVGEKTRLPDADLLRVLSQVSTQVGRALERKRAEDALREQLGRISLLNQIARAIAKRHDTYSTAHVVLAHLWHEMPLDVGSVLLADSENRVTVLASAGPVFKEGKPVDARAFAACLDGKQLDVPDTAADPAFKDFADAKIGAVVATALVEGEKTLGILVAGRAAARSFGAHDARFLTMLAEHLGLVVAQARLLSELRDANEELRSTQLQLVQQERLRALGEMASGVAHDFNNALSPILGFTELLLEIPDELKNEEKARRYLGMVRNAAQDGARVVSRLREFYRPRDRDEVRQPVHLSQLCEEVVLMTRPRWKDLAQASGADVTVVTDLQAAQPILANDSDMREVLTNLVFNAVDALPRGGVITIATREEPAHVILEVRDTGLGMTEEVRRRCLEPFFTTKGKKGTGLGLSMVHGIARRHDATLVVESTVGQGTTFRLRFPKAGAAPNETAAIVQRPCGRRVLVVEDQDDVREVVKALLEREGHRVQTARNGREALKVLGEGGHVDVVVTDRAMPEMGGDELALAVKTASPRTFVVLLSGFGEFMNAAGEKPPGIDAILSKPVSLAGLRDAFSLAPEPAS